MSTAFLITVPLMLLAIVIAVAPVLLVSIREHRPARVRNPRPGPTAPHRDDAPPVGASVAERQAAVVALEEAAVAVNRLKARGTVVGAGPVDVRLDEASSDLHRALVSLGGGVR